MNVKKIGLASVRTNAFTLSSKKLRAIRVHTTVLMRFRLSTLKRLKTIELHFVTYVELYTHATNTRACDIFGHRFHFDAFKTVHSTGTLNDGFHPKYIETSF